MPKSVPKSVQAIQESIRAALQPGEELLEARLAVPVASARGRGPALGALVATVLGHIGAVKGDATSIARSIPLVRNSYLAVTNERLTLWVLTDGRLLHNPVMGLKWATPLATVSRLEHRPRLQLLARFRVHFTDGSSAAFFTPRRVFCQELADALAK